MPGNVSAKHPLYVKWHWVWKRCRDASEGEDAVKAGADSYLPRLAGQTNDEYDGYLKRALFYGATGRTLEGLVGAVTRKPAQTQFPGGDTMKERLLDDLGIGGESLDLLAQQVLQEVLTVGRVGILVDAPEAAGGDPYVALYFVENIINWRERVLTDEEGNVRRRLTLVVLQEEALVEDPDDPYELKVEEHYRVLSLDDADEEDPGSGVYTVRVYKRAQTVADANARQVTPVPEEVDSAEFELLEETTPTLAGGQTLNWIPFTFITPSTTGSNVEKPPLLDLVNVNLSHYRTTADLEHGLHYTALPTAWVAGFDVKQSQLKIGSAVAWVSENPGAHAGFLEFTGAGLGALRSALQDKQQQMAVLGARLLEEQPSVPDTATAVTIRQSGERSVLAKVAGTVSEGMTKILRWVGEWVGLDPAGISYALNQDYAGSKADPATLQFAFSAMQGGAYSFEAWYNFLNKAELYPDGWTMEKEVNAIQTGNSDGTPPPDQGDQEQGAVPDNQQANQGGAASAGADNQAA